MIYYSPFGWETREFGAILLPLVFPFAAWGGSSPQNLVEKEHRLNDKNLFLIFPHLQVDYFNRGLIDRGLDSHISDPAVQLKNADTFYKYLGWEVSTDKDRQNDMIKQKW